MTGIFWGCLVISVFFLGFAYIIWVMASKEKNGLKTIGQAIGVVMMLLSAVILLYCGFYGGVMGRGCFGRGAPAWGPKSMRHMMLLPEREKQRYMKQMMKSPQIREWMKEYMEEDKK